MKNRPLIPMILAVAMSFCFFTLFGQYIEAGGQHTLFVCPDSLANVWGFNSVGQLGDGTTTDSNIPILNSLPSGVKTTAGGHKFSLFLMNDGTVWACGDNGRGQLGDGTATSHAAPAQIPGLTGIIGIAAGDSHSLFLKNDGTVWGCGYSLYGQLGDSALYTSQTTIIQINISQVVAIAAGTQHSLFLKSDSTVWACGGIGYGQLGDTTLTGPTSTPNQIPGLTGIAKIAAGSEHSLFLKSDGTVWACGDNIYGDLGDGTSVKRGYPVQVSGLNGIADISGGQKFSLFLKNDGTVWACGENFDGELGIGSSGGWESPPLQVININNVTDIAAGWFHSLFLKNDGTLWACGQGQYGQLGDGANVERDTAVQVSALCTATGMDQQNEQLQLSVYPNPVSNTFTVSLNTEDEWCFQLHDIEGKLVLKDHTSSYYDMRLDVSQLQSGMYFYRIESIHGTLNGKLIIAR